jgi:catechol 2,3-dioxygenase-like lactoylglutathione lyase family enzyme
VSTGFHELDLSFRPGRSISGFRTGDLGLGHVVLLSPRVGPLMYFYRDVLGFGLSDYVKDPFEAFFLHVNARHHSLAIIQSEECQVHHVMLEFNSLDDVGQGYDLAQERPDRVAVTLGRHSNDHMTSFYAKSPSGHMVECGWGGLSIAPDSWCPVELTDGPSIWGHDRAWLSAEARVSTRQMQIAAAARGVRRPVHVSGDNYDVSER